MPPLLLALVGMILEGPSMKDKMADTNPAEINEAQILNFNSVKHKHVAPHHPHKKELSTVIHTLA